MRVAHIPSVVILITLTSLALSAQAPIESVSSDSASVPTLHVTSRLVVLDVVVTDANGNPAHGLQPSDFTIAEDSKPQHLASFAEHGAVSSSPATPLPPNTFAVQTPPPEDQTKTIIVLADSTSWSINAKAPEFPSGTAVNTGYVREDIAAFLKSAPSTQPVAIVRLDWQGMHLVQGLTTDRDILTQAITSKRMLPPLGFVVPFARTFGAKDALIRYVNSIPGRINLVWIAYGGGMPGDPASDFPDLADVVQNLSGQADVLHLSRVAPYPIPLVQQFLGPKSPIALRAAAAGGHLYLTGIRQALSEITATGSDYYTISYIPTNPEWNGKFRRIKVEVAGYPQPPPTETWSAFWSEALGWAEHEKSKVIYRAGYFARPPDSSMNSPAYSPTTPTARPVAGAPAPLRKIISVSSKGDPYAAPYPELGKALAFGTLTPDQLRFTIAATPSAQRQKLSPGAPLPEESQLAAPFRMDAYRNIRIHYHLDIHGLQFKQVDGESYADALQFVVVAYRDDGTLANFAATTEQVRILVSNMQAALANGITFEQTIAVPVAGNPVPGSFFLRAAITEKASGRVGTIEIPAEWIKLPSALPSPTLNKP